MSKSVQLESKLRDNVSKFLSKQGEKLYKLKVVGSASQATGTPDFLLCVNGHFVALELKREHYGSYGVTPPQNIRMRKIRKAGGYAFCVASVEEVKLIVDFLSSCTDRDCNSRLYSCSYCQRPFIGVGGGKCEECTSRGY